MASNIEKIAEEIKDLEQQGITLLNDLVERAQGDKSKGGEFGRHYESWYTISRRVIAQLIPEREVDFVNLYRYPGNRKAANYETYRIHDYLNGTVVTDGFGTEVFSPSSRAFSQFQIQVQILNSARTRSTSALMDIKDVLAADLFDSEIDKARALHKNKLLREAGVIAGVVLENHLQSVAKAHAVKIAKKEPTINDLNEPLKNAGAYDLPVFRHIQLLADIRNLCDHKKPKDPTPEQVLDLIDGVDKVVKTVF